MYGPESLDDEKLKEFAEGLAGPSLRAILTGCGTGGPSGFATLAALQVLADAYAEIPSVPVLPLHLAEQLMEAATGLAEMARAVLADEVARRTAGRAAARASGEEETDGRGNGQDGRDRR